MSKSPVTDFFIAYLKEKQISPEEVSRELNIDVRKFSPGYGEPLDAEEFLELCVYLKITPEQVSRELRKGKKESEKNE